MLSLDSKRRQAWKKSQSCFRCYSGPNFGGDNLAPCQDARLDTEDFPKTKCSGIRSTVNYPTCWDGKNLDSANHQDHVAYPTKGPASFSDTAFTCPDTHPVRVPQISLEIVWDTTEFDGLWDPATDEQPFRLSMMDDTGYGQHGDYVFGWKGTSLQQAMDGGCFGPSCAGLKTQAFTEANKCKVKDLVQEDIGTDGCKYPASFGCFCSPSLAGGFVIANGSSQGSRGFLDKLRCRLMLVREENTVYTPVPLTSASGV
jgi:hypothetical protein